MCKSKTLGLKTKQRKAGEMKATKEEIEDLKAKLKKAKAQAFEVYEAVSWAAGDFGWLEDTLFAYRAYLKAEGVAK